ICVLGADHDAYAKTIKTAVKALKADIKHATPICQLVTFNLEGKSVKFSKRKGNAVRLADFLEEVSKDVVRFLMLSKKLGAPFIFDYEQALEVSMKNPVFYVQYASARAHSVLRNAKDIIPQFFESDIFQVNEYQTLLIAMNDWKKVLR